MNPVALVPDEQLGKGGKTGLGMDGYGWSLLSSSGDEMIGRNWRGSKGLVMRVN